MRGEGGAAGQAVRAMSTALSLAGTLLAHELHGGDAAPTPRTMFGGGYEVAMFLGGRFQKIGDITFVVWTAHVSAGHVKLSPRMLLKQQYEKDVLLMRSALLATEDGKLGLKGEDAFMTWPMHPTDVVITLAMLNATSFASRIFCHCFLVNGSGVYARVVRIQHEANDPLTLEVSDTQLALGITDGFMKDVARALLMQFPAD